MTNVQRAAIIKRTESAKQRPGKAAYLKYLKGGHLTRSQSIAAKCFECNGDSTVCEIEACPLLPFSKFCPQDKRRDTPEQTEDGTIGSDMG